MNRTEPSMGVMVPQQDPKLDFVADVADSVQQRREVTTPLAGEPRRTASQVRLTLASRLGNKIDGAWWPRTGLMSRELTELVSVLDVRLGQIIDINVNWSSLQCPPSLNGLGWQALHQRIMTVGGRNARANLLIVPNRTGTALAILVLRRAAGPPIDPAHRDSQACRTADCIARVARGEKV